MTDPLARAEFDYTLAEIADVSWRAARHSPVFRAQQRRTTILIGVLAGVLVSGALAVKEGGASPAVLVSVGIAVALLFATWRVLRLPSLYRRAAAALARDRHGDGPFRCVVELSSEHVQLRQAGLDLHFAWPQVLAVTPDGDDLEIRARGGVIVVRGRAFTDATERTEFAATAARLHAAGRSGA